MHRPVVRNPTNRLNLQRSRPHRLLAHGSGTLLSVQGSQHRVRADVSGSSSSSHFARSLHRMASPSIRDRARNRKPDRTAATSSESDRAAIDRARPRCFVTYRDFPRHTVHLGGLLSRSRDEARRPSLCNPALLSDVRLQVLPGIEFANRLIKNYVSLFNRPVRAGRSKQDSAVGRNVIDQAPRQGMRYRAGVLGLLLLMNSAGLSGCNVPWLLAGSAPLLDHSRFMSAWSTYVHCRSSSEPDEIRADLRQLTDLAEAETMQHHAPRLLPAAIRSLMATLPSRLAVDPQSMVAACALHGGHVAQWAGRSDLSEELFGSVARTQHEPGAAYYAVEAGRRLTHMKEERPVLWQRMHAPIPTSSE